MAVKIVTDSTSDLPHELARSLDITVVPLKVRFGEQEFRDGVDLSPDEFYRRLMGESALPKTSQPSAGEFAEAYQRLARDADGIVSVHISSKVSGTLNSALQGKEQAKASCPIEVIDTYQASMGVGMVAMVAARAAQRGAPFEEVVSVARRAVERCQCFVLLDTLEYLEKGGRIGKARAMLGTLLKIKPMVIVREGEVHELGKERTRARGIARLDRTAREFAPIEEMSILYSTTPDEARALAQTVRDLLPDGKEPLIARFGPVLGTYVGPGALGIGLLQARPRSP